VDSKFVELTSDRTGRGVKRALVESAQSVKSRKKSAKGKKRGVKRVMSGSSPRKKGAKFAKVSL